MFILYLFYDIINVDFKLNCCIFDFFFFFEDLHQILYFRKIHYYWESNFPVNHICPYVWSVGRLVGWSVWFKKWFLCKFLQVNRLDGSNLAFLKMIK